MAALGFMATGGDDALSAADTEEDTRSAWDSDDTDSDDMPELVSPSSIESDDDDVPASNGDESILFVDGPQPRATPATTTRDDRFVVRPSHATLWAQPNDSQPLDTAAGKLLREWVRLRMTMADDERRGWNFDETHSSPTHTRCSPKS